ncbi:MAG: fadD [Gammaproteobacteria bacterium]|jgi:long-chain acyl-CoA synthetase|nr:fadD [Gammaproteobacteria bacterium]
MEKIWLHFYPSDVPEEIDLSAHETIVDLFTYSCAKYRDKPAISNFGVTLTYRQLDTFSQNFAAYLQQELRLKKGDRIAIMLPNTLQYYVAIFAALRAGLVVVNVNPLYTPNELVHQLSDADAAAIIVLSNFATTVQKALPETTLKHVIITQIGDLFGFPRKNLINFIVRYIKKAIPDYQLPNAIEFSQALEIGEGKMFRPVELKENDMACLQYTGGTTGVAKGAVLLHRNLIANAKQADTWVKGCGLEEGIEVAIIPLPLYHIFSFTVCALTFFRLGVHTVLVTNPRDISALIKLMKKKPFSVFLGINTLFNALLHQQEFKDINFSKLKLTISGGMALQQKIAETWYEKTGNKILEGYGLTEASPIVTINPPNQAVFSGAIGIPVPSTEVAFKDNDEVDVPLGEKGEFCVKGPQVMQGYWRNDSETALAFTKDQYLKTGDIGRMDEKGLIYLVDRKKDMILVSGFNVYPSEVEAILTAHPKIREAGVVGIPCEKTGEMVKAFLVREDNTLTQEAVTAYCYEHLAHYKVPKSIVFVEELPKSSVGKVLRRKLQALDT